LENRHSNVLVIGKNAHTPLVEGNGLSIGSYVGNLKKAADSDLHPEIWCVDYPASITEWRLLLRQPKKRRSLIRYEPSVVLPRTHSRIYLSLFSNSIDVGRSSASNPRNVSLWPQTWGEPAQGGDSERSQRIVVINGDKPSFVHGELYSLRRKCLKEIASLDLFGHGWHKSKITRVKIVLAELVICVWGGRRPHLPAVRDWFSKPTNYLGPTKNKRETLMGYKYSLVIENSREFLTEKLFDSLLAGTIPIYVGPPVDQFQIPQHLVIQVAPNVQAIREGIVAATKVDYQLWLENVNHWLRREETRNSWSSEAVFQKIVETLTASGAN
jgi:hypothetical protein